MNYIYVILTINENKQAFYQDVKFSLEDTFEYIESTVNKDMPIFIVHDDTDANIKLYRPYIKVIKKSVLISKKINEDHKVDSNDKDTLTVDEFNKIYDHIKKFGFYTSPDDKYTYGDVKCYVRGDGSTQYIKTENCLIELTYNNDINILRGNTELFLKEIKEEIPL